MSLPPTKPRREWSTKIGRWIALAEGEIAVTCWCERDVVAVPRRDVFAGKTHTCGLPACVGVLV